MCYVKLPTVQDTFRPIPGFIWHGVRDSILLSHAQNAVMRVSTFNVNSGNTAMA